jgi:hypothetical protein
LWYNRLVRGDSLYTRLLREDSLYTILLREDPLGTRLLREDSLDTREISPSLDTRLIGKMLGGLLMAYIYPLIFTTLIINVILS